ncbi:hypothetical protein SY2F82_23800 [Streptomyces sp. Y2F8-2]|nr:hypothetical protein SY2F82_23800 [Streptomyces sp. Y2F8-2]
MTASVVPTVMVLLVFSLAGSNCHPPTPAAANTSTAARIRMRTDRIGAPPQALSAYHSPVAMITQPQCFKWGKRH